MARVNKGITQYYTLPERLSINGMNHTCLYFAAALVGTYFPPR